MKKRKSNAAALPILCAIGFLMLPVVVFAIGSSLIGDGFSPIRPIWLFCVFVSLQFGVIVAILTAVRISSSSGSKRTGSVNSSSSRSRSTASCDADIFGSDQLQQNAVRMQQQMHEDAMRMNQQAHETAMNMHQQTYDDTMQLQQQAVDLSQQSFDSFQPPMDFGPPMGF